MGNGTFIGRNQLKRFWICLLTGTINLTIVSLCLIHFAHSTVSEAIAAVPSSNDSMWTTYTTPTFNLPSNTVWGGVIVDGDGNIWAGFQNGYLGDPLPIQPLISRWDGETWATYDLPGCRVMALAAGGTNVYAGTYCPAPPTGNGGGLSWFVDGTWVNFTPADGLVGSYISAIAPEGDTKVWVAAGYAQVYYHSINLLDHKGTASKLDDEWSIIEIPADCLCNVRAIAIDPAGNRWFGTSDDGIWVLEEDSSAWYHHTSDVVSGPSDIVFDEMGNTWVLENTSQVAQYDGSEWTHFSREEVIEENYNLIMSSIDRNYVDYDGDTGLWAIEGEAGLWIINGFREGVSFYDGQSWKQYTSQSSGLGGDRVYGIATDQQGNVWFATESAYGTPETGGVSQFIPTSELGLILSPNWFMVEQNDSISLDVSVSSLRGWIPTATLTVTNPISATEFVFSANPVTPTTETQLIISTTFDTPFGFYPLSVMATSPEISRTSTVTMYVVPEVYQSFFPVLFK